MKAELVLLLLFSLAFYSIDGHKYHNTRALLNKHGFGNSFRNGFVAVITATLLVNPLACTAAEVQSKIIYRSGKTPVGTVKSSSDPKAGTKKETSFLKSMSNCKTDCQQPGEGLAKNDCVQDCQDQCCNSYEQCSFKIKSTAGNSI